VEKDREALKDRVPHPMSRNSSRQATERNSGSVTRSPPPQVVATPPTPGSPRVSHTTPVTSSNVRPLFSFAHAAGTKRDAPDTKAEEKEDAHVDQITEQVAEVTV
jgi:translation initiation factor 4B